MRRLLAVMVLVVLSGCQGQDESPALGCAGRSDCPAGYACDEPSATCVPEPRCVADADCCPGFVCISGGCQSFDECSSTAPCAARDRVCDNGVCISAMCGAEGAGSPCSSPENTCVGGRCLAVPLCGGCAGDSVCEPLTGRCLTAPSGCVGLVCTPGTARVVTNGGDLRGLQCDFGRAVCACVPLPGLAPLVPSGYLSVVAVSEGVVRVIGQDLGMGDLVVGDPASPLLAVLGVPDGPVVADPTGPRGGIAEPGPNIGRYAGGASYGEGLLLLGHDEGAKAVAIATVDPQSHLIGKTTLPGPERSGLGIAVVRMPSNEFVSTWFVIRPTGDTELVVGSLPSGSDPLVATEWSISTLAGDVGVTPTAAPCGATCGTLEACIDAPSGATCGSPDLVATCDPSCDRGSLCVGAACQPLARRNSGRAGLDGPGPESAVTAWNDSPIALAYSPTVGAADLWVRVDGAWSMSRLEGGGGANAGMSPAIAATPLRIAAAFEVGAPHRVRVFAGSSPSTLAPTLVAGFGGRAPDVAITSDDRVIAVWGRADGNGLVIASDQNGWSEIPIGDQSNIGRTNAVLLSPTGVRVFTIRDSVDPRGLRFELIDLQVAAP